MQNYASAMVTIADNDVVSITLPVITISPLFEGPVVEGEKAQFLISSSQRPASDLIVRLSISYDYKDSFTPIPASAVIEAETSSVIFAFDTFTDDEALPAVNYTVALVASSTYTLGTPHKAKIVANDNDLDEYLPNPNADKDRDPPTISITANQYFLYENEDATV